VLVFTALSSCLWSLFFLLFVTLPLRRLLFPSALVLRQHPDLGFGRPAPFFLITSVSNPALLCISFSDWRVHAVPLPLILYCLFFLISVAQCLARSRLFWQGSPPPLVLRRVFLFNRLIYPLRAPSSLILFFCGRTTAYTATSFRVPAVWIISNSKTLFPLFPFRES